MKKSVDTLLFYLVIAFFLTIYLLFPSQNNSIDAWGFAAYVKSGENLFLSHHLLYNALGFIWCKIVGVFFSFDTLKLLVVLNALFSTATLYVLGKTLIKLGVSGYRAIAWVAFAGSSWAIMRYATENETYVIPLFFSTLGSFYFIKGDSRRNFFFSGIFAATACLFHQVMFFWWLALLIGTIYKRYKGSILFYVLPALIVPVTYIIILVFYQDQPISVDAIMRFVFRDYYLGAAGVSIGFGSLLLTAISFFRSFLQVHGYFTLLLSKGILYSFVGVVAIAAISVGFFGIKRVKWKFKEVKRVNVWVHILAILFQLVFAFLSSGNAEFMVMIPVLFAIVFSQLIENETKFVGFVAFGLFLWNFGLGLIPLNRERIDSNYLMSEKVLVDQRNHKKILFVLINKPWVENRVRYFTGIDPTNIITGTQIDSVGKTQKRIEQALLNDTIVYTDCVERPKTLSRETLVLRNKFEDLFKGFIFTKKDTIVTLSGSYYVSKIQRK